MANTNYPSTGNPNQPEKETRTTTTSSNNSKNILIGVLAAFLLGTWAYFLYDKNDSNKQIHVKTAEATTALTAKDSVQLLYNDALTRLDSITGSNNSISGQLSDRQSEITKIKNEINKIMRDKNASAADLTRARSLISELNGRIANLESEVARLTGENQQLAATNVHLTGERNVLQTNLQTTTAEKEELAQTVDVASTFSASNIRITPIDERRKGKEKETTTAKRVDKLVVSFDVENRVARSGPADLYIIVTGPDGKVISDASMGSGILSTRSEGEKPFTYRTSIEYEQGTRKTVQVPLRQAGFQTGDYRIEIFQNGFKIAEGIRTLKKGGLFG
jgi:predicted  nucleic acid-binding Zn-ribbon protein